MITGSSAAIRLEFTERFRPPIPGSLRIQQHQVWKIVDRLGKGLFAAFGYADAEPLAIEDRPQVASSINAWLLGRADAARERMAQLMAGLDRNNP